MPAMKDGAPGGAYALVTPDALPSCTLTFGVRDLSEHRADSQYPYLLSTAKFKNKRQLGRRQAWNLWVIQWYKQTIKLQPFPQRPFDHMTVRIQLLHGRRGESMLLLEADISLILHLGKNPFNLQSSWKRNSCI